MNDRDKRILGDLKTMGIVDSNLSVTEERHTFLTNLSTKVIPVVDQDGRQRR